MQKYKYLRRNEAFFIKTFPNDTFLTEKEKDTKQETDHDESIFSLHFTMVCLFRILFF